MRAVFLCALLFLAGANAGEVCDENWVGSDCSIYSQPATSGVPYSGEVNTTKWKYYFVNVLEPSSITAVLTQDSEDDYCDLDLYVQKDGFPSFDTFMFREISTHTDSEIIVDDARGTYFFGVFGFSGCSYTIQFDTGSGCKCSNPEQGECVDGSSKCDCFSGFTGDACDQEYIVVTSGQQSVKVNTLGWTYYGLQVEEQPLRLKFELMLGGDDDDTHEADMYIAASRIPTLSNFDYRTPFGGEETLFDIVVNQPTSDTVYFIGIHAREQSTFHLTATIFPISAFCINRCSDHGACLEGTCSCNHGYSGLSCETMDAEFPLDTTQSGYVGQGAWNYYWVNLDTLSNAFIYVEQQSEDADCDLYVKRGNPPNFFNYDASEFSLLPSFFVSIASPGSGIWWIGVYGYSNCDYEVSVHEAITCSCAASSHGSCPDIGSTVCVCDPGWGGEGCTTRISNIESGQVVTGTVERLGWTYFTLRVPKSIGLTVAVREKSTIGLLWVFVGHKDAPTLTAYDHADRTISSSLHQIDVVQDFSDSEITIGVYGNPYAYESSVISFDLVAWSAPF